jgi:hypothetical protein
MAIDRFGGRPEILVFSRSSINDCPGASANLARGT